ncbi:hypothetical protein [Paenibacillus sp. FSL L8-0708]|uniref:hypothetical protein n=1 Tax=Paenibacillus sp. FSL L8-0708 TaxID=2975311 RepID=UPI0030F6CC83
MIQTVKFTSFLTGSQDDIIVLQRYGSDYGIVLALPFHEDTPNIRLTVPESFELRNAIDELLAVKLLENKGSINDLNIIDNDYEIVEEQTNVSRADQRSLCHLFDQYSRKTPENQAAIQAIRQVLTILGL